MNMIKSDARFQGNRAYIHRSIAGSDMLISTGNNISNFNGYIELNATAATIWDCVKEPCSLSFIVETVMSEYGIDHDTAQADVEEFLQELIDKEMVKVL